MHRLNVVSLRMVRDRTVPYRTKRLDNSASVYELFRELVEDLDRETFWVLCLNTKNQIACLSQISVGGVNSAPVHPREVFKVALLANATSVICLHNHPSGDPEPSPEDRAITAQIRNAAKMLGIRFLDHRAP